MSLPSGSDKLLVPVAHSDAVVAPTHPHPLITNDSQNNMKHTSSSWSQLGEKTTWLGLQKKLENKKK